MWQFIMRRLLSSIPVLLGVSVIVFLVMNVLPGDPVQLLLGNQGVEPEMLARLRQQLGLDDPLYVRYLKMVGGALHGARRSHAKTFKPRRGRR